MRKITFYLIIIMLLILSSCSQTAKPDSTVSKFLDASKSFDFEKMATYINESNQDAIKDLTQNNEDQYQQYFMDYLKGNASKIDYKVKDSKIDGDNATVTVDVKYVDGAPLLKATIGEFFTQALPIAFTGVELTDEQTSQMIVGAMEKQKRDIDETYVEKEIKVDCIKVDDQWLIDNPSDELLDVLMSNFITAGNEISDSFNSADGNGDATEDNTVMGEAKAENMDIINKKTGDEITFATIKLKVNDVKEDNVITAKYSEPTVAKEGAKFVILNVDITNITNSEFPFSTDGIVIVDDKGREFNSYSDSFLGIDNDMEYRNLAPSIKENGNLVYELPTDSANYALLIMKAGTNELYKIALE